MADTNEALRVVLFKENETWVAQCLEYDIQAQGTSFECAMRRLRAAVHSDALYTLEKHGTKFAGIGTAPELYREMFDGAAEPLQGGNNVELRIAA